MIDPGKMRERSSPLPLLLALALSSAAPAAAQITNQNPPPPPSPLASTGVAVLLDDISQGGFLRACVGENGALGASPCPAIDFGTVGLRVDPDGAAGPLPESEDAIQGFFEERWCVEHHLLSSQCNAIFVEDVPGFDQDDTGTPGRLQSTGSVTTPDGRLRIDQVVTLRSGSRCLDIDVTLTNVSGVTLTNVEYLRDHDPDFGNQMGLGPTTENQTVNRPLPGSTPPMFVASTVRGFSPLETRTVGLGTNATPAPGVLTDVSIHTSSLFYDDTDPTLDGTPPITRGPLVSDVGTAIAFRIASLAPGRARDLSLCYCLSSLPGTISPSLGMIAADLAAVFRRDCGILQVAIDIKPGSFPNSINPRSRGVIPVAILTTGDFDAAEVDPLTVRFGPGGASEAHGKGHFEDVDGDGDLDLVLHFSTTAAAIACGSTEATLSGETFDGRRIEGADSVRTTGCR